MITRTMIRTNAPPINPLTIAPTFVLVFVVVEKVGDSVGNGVGDGVGEDVDTSKTYAAPDSSSFFRAPTTATSLEMETSAPK